MIMHRISVLVLMFMALSSGCVCAAALHDFTSDGCSLFPDGNLQDRARWCDCCFTHDIAYWQGGSRDDRKLADERLRECVVKRTGNDALAELMYAGVRSGGNPAFPTWYRWGYGWKYGRGYAELNEQEKQQVRKKLDEYFSSHPEGYCRKGKSP
jgi:hypothetical protein